MGVEIGEKEGNVGERGVSMTWVGVFIGSGGGIICADRWGWGGCCCFVLFFSTCGWECANGCDLNAVSICGWGCYFSPVVRGVIFKNMFPPSVVESPLSLLLFRLNVVSIASDCSACVLVFFSFLKCLFFFFFQC